MAVQPQPIRFVRRRRVPSRLGLTAGGFASRPPCSFRPSLPIDGRPSSLRHSIAPSEKFRDINLMSIGCALRPGLRLRLTLGGRTCPRKPQTYGGRDSHPPYRYSCLHVHLYTVRRRFRFSFDPYTTLSYRSACAEPAASVPDLVPIIFGAESLDR